MMSPHVHPATIAWSQSIAVPGRDRPLVVGGEIAYEAFAPTDDPRHRTTVEERIAIADSLMTTVARSIEMALACDARKASQ